MRLGNDGQCPAWGAGASVIAVGGSAAPRAGNIQAAWPQVDAQVQAAAFEHGLLTRAPGDTLVLAPPFVSTPQQVDRMVERLHAAISETLDGDAS